jgi:hypothetical protein
MSRYSFFTLLTIAVFAFIVAQVDVLTLLPSHAHTSTRDLADLRRKPSVSSIFTYLLIIIA